MTARQRIDLSMRLLPPQLDKSAQKAGLIHDIPRLAWLSSSRNLLSLPKI